MNAVLSTEPVQRLWALMPAIEQSFSDLTVDFCLTMLPSTDALDMNNKILHAKRHAFNQREAESEARRRQRANEQRRADELKRQEEQRQAEHRQAKYRLALEREEQRKQVREAVVGSRWGC